MYQVFALLGVNDEQLFVGSEDECLAAARDAEAAGREIGGVVPLACGSTSGASPCPMCGEHGGAVPCQGPRYEERYEGSLEQARDQLQDLREMESADAAAEAAAEDDEPNPLANGFDIANLPRPTIVMDLESLPLPAPGGSYLLMVESPAGHPLARPTGEYPIYEGLDGETAYTHCPEGGRWVGNYEVLRHFSLKAVPEWRPSPIELLQQNALQQLQQPRQPVIAGCSACWGTGLVDGQECPFCEGTGMDIRKE